MARELRQIQQSIPSLREILLRFWPQIRKERRLIVLSSTVLVAEVGLRLAEPVPLKLVVDALVPTHKGVLGITLRNDLGLPLMLGVCTGSMVLVALLGAL